ncbi:Tyrosine recombinase XerC [Sporomusa carbonis]|uniref:tyrosine-type recombinase/integrase n=1 Tax=Sporomusa carbonis TaxID=3076075 RepID=UPI003A73AC00
MDRGRQRLQYFNSKQRLAAIHSFARYVQAETPENMFHCKEILDIPFKKKKSEPISLAIKNSNAFAKLYRHTKAMHLLQAGVNIVYIKDILGHVDISTTEIYARADTEMKRVALEKVNNIESPSVASWTNDTDLLSWLKDYGKAKP